MRSTILALTIALCSLPAAAQEARTLGVGPTLGDPTGASAKYFLNGRDAVDFGLGVSDTLVLWTDYSLHAWELLPQPSRGKLGAYVSLGGRWENQARNDWGLRALGGLSYWPRLKHPVELFVELGPCFRLSPAPARVRVDGSFGARWYFAAK
jgi:hypothetical protein